MKIVLGIIKRVEQFQQNVFDGVNCRPELDYIAKLKMNYTLFLKFWELQQKLFVREFSEPFKEKLSLDHL